jgi:hypothetical protein
MFIKSIVAATVLMLPVAAFAQSTDADAKYCNDMSAAYRAYTNNIDAEATRAMTACRTDPAAAIPVLEKHLKESKIPLPSRS